MIFVSQCDLMQLILKAQGQDDNDQIQNDGKKKRKGWKIIDAVDYYKGIKTLAHLV